MEDKIFKELLDSTIQKASDKKAHNKKTINDLIEKIKKEIYKNISLTNIKRSKSIKIILEILENNKI